MDSITLHGIEVWAQHGIQPDERVRGQPFIVHVTLELDLSDAAEHDDLASTVDYATVASEVHEIAAGGPHYLIETVAAKVLDRMLAHPRVHGAEVTIEKPHAPLPVPAAGVSVTMRRERQG